VKRVYVAIASFLISTSAQAQSAAGLTYHGRLLKPNGEPVASNVNFKVQILSPGSEQCVLWEETQSQDLTTTAGVFVLHLNGARSTRTDGGTTTFNEVFSNRKVLTPPSGKCAGSATNFDPTSLPAAPRLMRVSFNDGTFTGWEDTEDQAINYAPKAIDALQVSGFPATSLLRFAEPSGTLVNTSPLSNAQYTELLALLDGTSTKYMTTSGGTSIANGAPSSLSPGKIWLDGTDLKYYDGTATQTLGTATSSTQWSSGSGDISYAGRVGIGVTAPTAKFEVKGATSDNTAAAANFMNSAGVSALFVRNDGYVGIGTTSPGALLQVGSATGFRVNATGNIVSIGGDTGATLSSGSLNLRAPGSTAVVANSSTASNSSSLFQGSSSTNGSLLLRSTGGVGSGDYVEIQGGNAGATTIARFTGAGNVGIGTTSTNARLDVRGPLASATVPFNQVSYDTAAFAADVGSGIGFGGAQDSTPTYSTFAGVRGQKENGTSGNNAGYLSFLTRSNGAGVSEKMRITSDGKVGIGSANPSSTLSFGGDSPRSIAMERGSVNGNDLTISSGGAPSGATDKKAGDLYLTTGVSTGSGNASIFFQTSAANATGSADRALATRMQIDGFGNIGVGGNGTNSNAKLYSANLRTNHGTSLTSAVFGQSLPTQTAGSSTGDMFGLYGQVNASIPSATASIAGTLAGVNGQGLISNAGTIGTAASLVGVRSVYGIDAAASSSAKVTNAYGIYVLPKHEAGTINSSYGVRIDAPTTGGTVTNEWGLYVASTTAKNHFGGSVGIGLTSPGVKLDVAGQIRSVSSTGATKVNATAAVDWDNGNIQSLSSACTATTFTNMVDGGSYTLAVTDTSATQCVFSQAGLTFYFTPANAPRTSGRPTVYSFIRVGTNVYVTWAVLHP
jgi:hypothetical protein